MDLIGHRGARGLAPENTLAAFARAIEIGVSGFELDCAITRDGVVVIHHDALMNPDFARGPDGKWLSAAGPAIATLDYTDLLRYDVGRIQPGSGYERRFPVQQPVDGTRIPRLADLFALARNGGYDGLRFWIELKLSPLAPERTVGPDEFARRVIAVVREHGMSDRSALLSFDWRALAAARREAADIPIVCLTAQQSWQDNILAVADSSPWTAPLHVNRFGGSLPRMVHAACGSTWAPYYEELTPALLAEARTLGLKVVVWTVNEPADMRRMIGLGVDGIISDYPDRLRQVAGEAGIALPRATPVAP
ncbi:MAG TPA: glycerophosphodiester phosphodiesterase [Burkholderiales bacterium]|nr:glycerophosphodiester phosphodiesterase [Burkholderiales bacterium]